MESQKPINNIKPKLRNRIIYNKKPNTYCIKHKEKTHYMLRNCNLKKKTQNLLRSFNVSLTKSSTTNIKGNNHLLLHHKSPIACQSFTHFLYTL